MVGGVLGEGDILEPFEYQGAISADIGDTAGCRVGAEVDE